MRFISLLVSLCFTFNVMAATGTVQELERHLDDYQYALTVEWDQKDASFYESQTKIFFDKMGTLMTDKGLTKEEVLVMVDKKMSNKKALNALKLKVALMGDVNSSEELAKTLKESVNGMYSQGASWVGETFLIGGIVLAIGAAIGYAIWFGASHKCVEWEPRWKCYTYTDHHDDSWGRYSTTETSCGWEDVCVRYEKK